MEKQINWFENLIGSGVYTGYIPIASGTFGSFVALLIYLIPGFENPVIIIPVTVLLFVYGVFVSGKFENKFGKDPAECTVDEFVGMWISLILLPKDLLIIAAAFFIWRVFDIIKPFPANKLEDIKGGWGVMLDDVMSAVYSLIIIHLIVYIFYS